MRRLFLVGCLYLLFETHGVAIATQTGKGYVYRKSRPSQQDFNPQWDENGYLFFCLCMGRLGNQIEHFLGGLALAKEINRTLVLPPLRSYRNVRFTEWFQFGPLLDYHRVILAEDFIEHLAPEHWPPGNRTGFCFKLPTDTSKSQCEMKGGHPFGPFWDGLNVDFDNYEFHSASYSYPDGFKTRFPPAQYSVLAMRGAPAPFPMDPKNWWLQHFLVFSERVEEDLDDYRNKHFPGEKYIGLHLRNGLDWSNACKQAAGRREFMASPQCLADTTHVITEDMCMPSVAEILRVTKNLVLETAIKVVVVATDKNPLLTELQAHLENFEVRVFHMDPHLPIVDVNMLVKADHFVGNCISSFTAFATRVRRSQGKSVDYWGLV